MACVFVYHVMARFPSTQRLGQDKTMLVSSWKGRNLRRCRAECLREAMIIIHFARSLSILWAHDSFCDGLYFLWNLFCSPDAAVHVFHVNHLFIHKKCRKADFLLRGGSICALFGAAIFPSKNKNARGSVGQGLLRIGKYWLGRVCHCNAVPMPCARHVLRDVTPPWVHATWPCLRLCSIAIGTLQDCFRMALQGSLIGAFSIK